jgi:Fe2+ transport system protein FeoA
VVFNWLDFAIVILHLAVGLVEQMSMNPIRVADLDVSIESAIVDITAAPAVRERLLELGISPGRSLRVLRKLPYRGPVIVQAGSLFLALRRDEAEQVWVR